MISFFLLGALNYIDLPIFMKKYKTTFSISKNSIKSPLVIVNQFTFSNENISVTFTIVLM